MQNSPEATSIVTQANSKVNLLPSLEYLNECFSYDPVSGELTWKERPISHFINLKAQRRFNGMFCGKPAGGRAVKKNGNRRGIEIGIRSNSQKLVVLMAHNVIAKMMGVDVPDGHEMDHRNRDPWDNRWCNLRLSTKSQNCCNRKERADKKSGLPKGVFHKGKKFSASIGVGRRRKWLGVFSTPEAAELAYKDAAQRLHGEFALHLSKTELA